MADLAARHTAQKTSLNLLRHNELLTAALFELSGQRPNIRGIQKVIPVVQKRYAGRYVFVDSPPTGDGVGDQTAWWTEESI